MSLPAAIERTPRLDRWLRFAADGTVVVYTGKVEIGQGITTALAMIVAEELDVELDRIRVQTADTELTPNEMYTAGSLSVEDSGGALRVAAAQARVTLAARAAAELGVGVDTLQVRDGLISSSASNEQRDYWQLAAGAPLAVEIRELPPLKDVHGYRLVGSKASRLDLPAKVGGRVAFVHDMVLPHMLHARVVKPPAQQATCGP